MMLPPKLSPSMMCADLFRIGETIRVLEQNGASLLHIDVMDGSFVPNLTLGTEAVRQFREFAAVPMDIHLMTEDPGTKLEWFGVEDGDYVSVHAEATRHLQRVLAKIRSLGGKPVAALNPATPLCAIEDVLVDVDAVLIMTVNPGYAGQKLIPQTLDKISRLRKQLDDMGLDHVEIEVDGNITLENTIKMRQAGANIFVAGTSMLFREGILEDHVRAFNALFK